MIRAARLGGRETLRFFNQRMNERAKGFGDTVTQADLASEKKIIRHLSKHFPRYNIFSEERGRINRGSHYTFVIDPLDGTANFKSNSALFTTSIALREDGATIIGVVYVPITDELFRAVRGSGAFKDGRRITVAKPALQRQTIVGYNQGWNVAWHRGVAIINYLWRLRFYRVVNNWSPALDLCRLAEGKLDGMIVNRAQLYDIAAGKLIAAEAKAIITKPFHEDDETTFVAANGQPLIKKLKKIVSMLKNG